MTSDQLVTAYGFVGAGEITAAIVEGIHTDAADSPAIFLSPRGHDVARELAGRYANVQVCDSNQTVLDSDGVPDSVRRALDRILVRLRG